MEYITPFLYLLNTMAPYLLLGFLLFYVLPFGQVVWDSLSQGSMRATFRSPISARWRWLPSSACRCPCVRAA